jgi:hypothetical protein
MTQKTGTWYENNVGSTFGGIVSETAMKAARDDGRMQTALKVAAGIAAVGVTLYLVDSYMKKRDLERMGPKNLRQLGQYVAPRRMNPVNTDYSYERPYRVPTEYGGMALNTRQIQRLAAQRGIY